MVEFDPDQLKAFQATIEQGTLDAAARSLHVTPSAVSQRLKALESQVGRVLFERSKPVTVTESGAAVLQLARQVEQLSADTARVLGSSSERPGVAVVINGDSLSTWAMEAIAVVAQDLAVEVVRENEDHSIGLLREGRVMAVVSTESTPVQGCSSTYLGEMRYRPMAAPDFARDHFAEGPSSEAFGLAPMLLFDRKDGLQDAFLRRRWRRLPTPPRNFIPSSREYTQAAVMGIGWGLVPEPEAASLEAAGDLVDIDPGQYQPVKLYWQQWRLSSPPLDRFASVIKEVAGRRLFR